MLVQDFQQGPSKVGWLVFAGEESLPNSDIRPAVWTISRIAPAIRLTIADISPRVFLETNALREIVGNVMSYSSFPSGVNVLVPYGVERRVSSTTEVERLAGIWAWTEGGAQRLEKSKVEPPVELFLGRCGGGCGP